MTDDRYRALTAMTLSVLARAGNVVGVATASSSPAVGARCIAAIADVGVVAVQNFTDPRLRDGLLEAMASGVPASAAVEAIAAEPHAEYRQLAALPWRGPGAWFSGARTLPVYGALSYTDAIAVGNNLQSLAALQAAMDRVAATRSRTGEGVGHLARLLVYALTAADEAGCEIVPLTSAALQVAQGGLWNTIDLRVDSHAEPLSELQRVLTVWLPEVGDYVARGTRPGAAPDFRNGTTDR